jgi:hypothetical protein
MAQSKPVPATGRLLPQMKGYGAAHHLMILGLLLFILMFLACMTLPKPESRTLTFAHDPQPDNHRVR